MKLDFCLGKMSDPQAEAKRNEHNTRVLEDYRARKYTGLTPEEIKAVELKEFERISNQPAHSGFGHSYQGLDLSHHETNPEQPMTPEQIKELSEKRERLANETIEQKRARWAKTAERWKEKEK